MKNGISLLTVFLFVGIFWSSNTFCQQFKRTYNYFQNIDGEGNADEPIQTKTVVVFNANNSNDIIIYFESGVVQEYTGVGIVEVGETRGGYSFQIIRGLNEDGVEVTFQLFDDIPVLRMLFGSEGSIEFSE